MKPVHVVPDFYKNTICHWKSSLPVFNESFFDYWQVGHVYAGEKYVCSRPGFNVFAMFTIVSGKAIVEYEDKVYEMNSGDLYFADFQNYNLIRHNGSEDLEFYYIFMNGPNMKALQNRFFKKYSVVTKLKNNKYIIEKINMLIKKRDILDNDLYLLSSLLYSLIMEIERLLSPVKNNESKLITSIKDVINNNYLSSLSLDIIAKKVYSNKYYISHKFKKEVGISIVKYLMITRLNKAKELLGNTDLSLDEVASKAGFEDTRTFSRNFKLEYMITPLQYRKFTRVKK